MEHESNKGRKADGAKHRLIKESEGTVEITLSVGNVGNIDFSSEGLKKAKSAFNQYVEQSKNGYGRVAGEDVSLMVDGEIEEEYSGLLGYLDNDDDGSIGEYIDTQRNYDYDKYLLWKNGKQEDGGFDTDKHHTTLKRTVESKRNKKVNETVDKSQMVKLTWQGIKQTISPECTLSNAAKAVNEGINSGSKYIEDYKCYTFNDNVNITPQLVELVQDSCDHKWSGESGGDAESGPITYAWCDKCGKSEVSYGM